jgi:hypothetical protein
MRIDGVYNGSGGSWLRRRRRAVVSERNTGQPDNITVDSMPFRLVPRFGTAGT